MAVPKFSKQDQQILKKYFTNTNKNIFCLINLPEVIKGTLFSRYSRSDKNLRQLFIDEFLNREGIKDLIQDSKSAKSISELDVKRAENFYDRVLLGFGDDSVAELGGAHIAVERASMLTVKMIEEHRIGFSPLENSSRYIYYYNKVNGQYQFYKDPTIMKSKYKKLYLDTINNLFEVYSKIIKDIQPKLKQIYPPDGKEDTAYLTSIKAKACDTVRGMLPIAAQTNVGMFGNGRAYEYLITHLLSSPLEECRQVGKELHQELRKVIPSFVKKAANEKGQVYQKYLKDTQATLAPLNKRFSQPDKSVKQAKAILIDYDRDAVDKVIAGIVYENSNLAFKQAYSQAKKLSAGQKTKLLKDYVKHRQGKYHKPGRALENTTFGFEVLADWGVYKDIQRHRILTRMIHLFTNELGYITPKEIEVCGFKKQYQQAMDQALDAYTTIKKDFPYQAQYLVTHGAYNRFYMKFNLREAVHLSELRSVRQGHPTYRYIAQEIAKEITKKFPLFKEVLAFVDYNQYGLERLEAFKRLEEKKQRLGVKN